MCGTHARGFCSNDLSPDAGWACAAHAPFGLPEKVQAAFKGQCASFAYGTSQAAGIEEMKMSGWVTPASLARKIRGLNKGK